MAEIMTYADDTDQIQEISQHIVISRDKSVYVPEIIRKSIVYRDHNVECLTFDCPRYWSGIDISELNIYVNYIAEGQKKKKEDPGSFLCENVVVDEDNTDIFHFDWRITNNASEFPDKLIFLVCAKSVDAEGNEDVHWNSHLCTSLEVQEGLEASSAIVKRYPDVIESILSKLGKQIELRNSGTAIQYRNTGENTWVDLVQLEDIRGEAAVIIESNFQGSDTTANILAKTGETGDKWYSTDDGVYYMFSSKGEWINCGSGENLKKIEDEIDALKGNISQLSEEIANLNGGMTTNAKALLGTLLRATVYDKDVLADPVTVIDSFLAELDKTVSPEEPDVPVDPEEPTTTYAVTYNLTSVTSSNNSTTVTDGASYTTVLSSDSAIDIVTVKMGGVDITESVYNSTSKTITIAETTGDIIITASIADSSLLYTLKDASFNGSTIVDTGVALFDESKDFTILFDFKNMDCGSNGTGYLGLVEDDTITDSYQYFVGRTSIANKNADTETIAFNICVKITPLVTAPSQASDSSSRTYSAKMAITFDSASNKWNGYIRNTATGESAEGTITKVVTTLANTIAIGGTNYRGKTSFTCNEFSIYNRVLSVDEISTWIQ